MEHGGAVEYPHGEFGLDSRVSREGLWRMTIYFDRDDCNLILPCDYPQWSVMLAYAVLS
jgi:hypothetical protein